MVIKIAYLIDKFKNKYRIRCPIDKTTNDFPRKINGQYEDIDLYIDCLHGNKIFHDTGSILIAYIPSLGRGRNIIKQIEDIDKSIIFNIEETDSEIMFKFKYVNSDKIIPLLKPKISGCGISPYSSKNLPKSDFTIPDDELSQYKDIIGNIPQNKLLSINVISNNFLKTLCTKNKKIEDIKADMKLKKLKTKEYIFTIGYWDKYLKYLSDKISKL